VKHYTFGGSTAARTLECPAWVNIAAKGPKLDRSSAAADRGTAMHGILEQAFDQFVTVAEVLGRAPHTFSEYDVEQMLAAERAVQKLFQQYQIYDYAVEPTFELSDQVGGSTDLIATGADVCLVIDYKFGRTAVDATSNKQLAFYHMLAGKDPQYRDMTYGKRFIGVIVQPAINYEPQLYEYPPLEVDYFETGMMLAIEMARGGETRPSAGDHCEWCPAVPYCSAKLNEAAAVIEGAFDPMKDLSKALSMLEPLKVFIASVESEALNAMSQQHEIPGWKLVAKKKLRKWASESAALVALKEAGYSETDLLTPGELKSPAQLDKFLKKSPIEFDVAHLLDTSEPGVTIAPESDPRAKYIVNKENANASSH
jgi:hypothetical protein